jgi:hypothetical protein
MSLWLCGFARDRLRIFFVTDRVHYHPDLIFAVGTQVVTLIDNLGSGGLTSDLPEAPSGGAALHDLLVRLRLYEQGGGGHG